MSLKLTYWEEKKMFFVEVCGAGECDRTKFGESPDYDIVELVDQLPTVFNSL